MASGQSMSCGGRELSNAGTAASSTMATRRVTSRWLLQRTAGALPAAILLPSVKKLVFAALARLCQLVGLYCG